jgi:hypothetical protein
LVERREAAEWHTDKRSISGRGHADRLIGNELAVDSRENTIIPVTEYL